MIYLAAIFMVLGTLAYLGYPVLRRDRSYAPDHVEGLARAEELRSEKEALLRAIKDLEFDVASGKLSTEDYTSLRSKYEMRAVAVLQELDAQETVVRQRKPIAVPPERRAASPMVPASSMWRRPALTFSVIGCLIGIIGAGGFLLGRVTQQETEQGMPRVDDQSGGSQMVVALETRLRQNPRDVDALVGLGRIYLQTGQMPKAIEMYKRALETDANNVSALSGMAMILVQAGHSEQALALFDKALAINPQVPMALLFKGRILYEDRKDYAGAIAQWQQFLQLMPQGGPADVVRGWIEEARREAGNTAGEGQPKRAMP